MPLKTNAWENDVPKEIRSEVLKFLNILLGKIRKVLLMVGFYAKEIRCEDMDVRGDYSSWGEDILQMVIHKHLTTAIFLYLPISCLLLYCYIIFVTSHLAELMSKLYENCLGLYFSS